MGNWWSMESRKHSTDNTPRRTDRGAKLSAEQLEDRTVPAVVAVNDQFTLQNGAPQTVSAAVGLLANDYDLAGATSTTTTETFNGLQLFPFPTGTHNAPFNSGKDWAEALPAGWTRDNTNTPTTPKAGEIFGQFYYGWHALNIDSWIQEQGDQDRSKWVNGGKPTTGNTVMVADGDGYDDYVSLATTKETSYLFTPKVSLINNKLSLTFDSSFRPEDPGTQDAFVDVTFDNGTTWVNLLHYNTDNTPGGVGAEDRIDEHLTLTPTVPAGAASAQFRFGYVNAENDWWWAIDNVAITRDTAPNAGLTAVKVSDPAHGTLTLNADGSISYAANAGYTGADSFTYKANNGTLDSNVATVNITVNPNNGGPVARNDRFTLNMGAALTRNSVGGVLANDSDPDSGNNLGLRAVKVTDPAHGTLTLNADGSFTYTPQASFFGTDTFTYKDNDGVHDGNVATVTFNVVNPAAAVQIESIAVNDGSAQRSEVKSITITFNTRVNLPATPDSAFQLSRTGPGTPTGNVTLAVDTSGSTADQTIVKLTFSGTLTDAAGSLIDGLYTLTVFGAQVIGPGNFQLDGDANGTPGGDRVTSLHRMYGDSNGDKKVDALDLFAFAGTFGKKRGDAGYIDYFDSNNDGAVDALDLFAFAGNFGKTLP